MHYYQFHINDYRAATAHLSNEEDLAYRRLLDMYYDLEQPIPLDTDWVARRLRVDTQVIATVLRDMFQQTENGWIHRRCDADIAHYQQMVTKNRTNGSKGGRPRKPTGNPLETDSEAKKTLTNNQEPITNNQEKKYKATVVAAPVGVSDDTWEAFKALRRAKKAPITKRAMDGIMAEAQKAGWSLDAALTEMAARGWTGFKADWVAIDPTKKTAGERNKAVLGGLTRGLVGGGGNVKLID